ATVEIPAKVATPPTVEIPARVATPATVEIPAKVATPIQSMAKEKTPSVFERLSGYLSPKNVQANSNSSNSSNTSNMELDASDRTYVPGANDAKRRKVDVQQQEQQAQVQQPVAEQPVAVVQNAALYQATVEVAGENPFAMPQQQQQGRRATRERKQKVPYTPRNN
ncbi:MAG: hypothetical protein JSS07_01885, partial [Proteobacteria bacterium]|nr:hypothetical protein [Pseudomonadota bacterium]